MTGRTDDATLTLARERVRIEMRERHLAFAKVLGDLTDQLTVAGQLSSGRRVVLVADAARREGQIRTAIAWNTLVSIAGTVGKRVTEIMPVQAAKEFVRTAFLDEAADMTRALDQLTDARLMNTPRFEKVVDDAVLKTNSDIDIAYAAAPTPLPPLSSQVVNIFQTYGIVQTGPASSAELTVSQDAAETLSVALAAVAAAVKSAPDVTTEQRADALDVVREIEVEVKKPHPNRIRLVGTLTGLASTVQTLGSAAAAYQLLKGAAALFGVSLP